MADDGAPDPWSGHREEDVSPRGRTPGVPSFLTTPAERRMDEQLVVALMATAAQAGRFAEAAEIMQSIADRTGDPKAAMLAEKLREKAGR